MADNAEYNKLVNEKANAQSQYNSCKGRIENYEYKLRRLKSAKGSIVEQKSLYESLKKSDENISKEKSSWKGATYNSFKSQMETLNEENERYYKYSIDFVLDSLNDEITRIENEKLREQGLLGRIGSWINSLSNEIENFFN